MGESVGTADAETVAAEVADAIAADCEEAKEEANAVAQEQLTPLVAPIRAWQSVLDERQRKQVAFSRVYAEQFGHGADGHNNMLIIAAMANLLDTLEGNTIELYNNYAQLAAKCVELEKGAQRNQQGFDRLQSAMQTIVVPSYYGKPN